jgi:type II secretory pathway component PulF
MQMFQKKKPNMQDLYHFFKVIKRYTAANIPEIKSVQMFQEETIKPALKKIIEMLLRDLRNGVEFPIALSKHPSFFPSFIIEMLKIGINSGQRTQILDEIVFYIEQKIDVKREVDAALWVPKVFLVGMLGAFFLAVMFVIPQMGNLLSDSHIELPLITQIVLGIGYAAQSLWWLFAILTVGGIAGYVYAKKEYPERVDLLKLHIPFFKKITYNQMHYQFTKVFGLCVQSGVDTKKALVYTAMASNHTILKTILKKAVSDMERYGISLPDAIKKEDIHHILDPSIFIMLRTGSKASDIGNIMLNESENYRKEMLVESRLLGDKIGVTVTIPGYAALVFIFAAIEYPMIAIFQGMNMGGMG